VSCCCCCRRSKKLTEYEKWEYKQLKMAGVLDVREYPLFDEEGGQGLLAGVDEVCGGMSVLGRGDCDCHNNPLFDEGDGPGRLAGVDEVSGWVGWVGDPGAGVVTVTLTHSTTPPQRK
jgi:hypothetical protein